MWEYERRHSSRSAHGIPQGEDPAPAGLRRVPACWSGEKLGCFYPVEVAQVRSIMEGTMASWTSPLRSGDEASDPDRDGRRLAVAAPTPGHHVSPHGKPRPASAARWPPAPSDRHRTPLPRGARPPAGTQAPPGHRHSRHTGHAPALVSATDRPEVCWEPAASPARASACRGGDRTACGSHGRRAPDVGLPPSPGCLGPSGACSGHADSAHYAASPPHGTRLAASSERDELAQVLRTHWEVLAATDCFTVERRHGMVS